MDVGEGATVWVAGVVGSASTSLIVVLVGTGACVTSAPFCVGVLSGASHADTIASTTPIPASNNTFDRIRRI